MFKSTVTYTRPSDAVAWWVPTSEQTNLILSKYQVERVKTLSEDGLTLTLESIFQSEADWAAYTADAELTNNEDRDAYNAANGITRTKVGTEEL